MKTIYTLTIRPSIRIPAGKLHLDVGGERTYLFRTIEERQVIVDWATANGWKYSTNIDFTLTPNQVKAEIREDIARCCEPFHYPVPSLVEA